MAPSVAARGWVVAGTLVVGWTFPGGPVFGVRTLVEATPVPVGAAVASLLAAPRRRRVAWPATCSRTLDIPGTLLPARTLLPRAILPGAIPTLPATLVPRTV